MEEGQDLSRRRMLVEGAAVIAATMLIRPSGAFAQANDDVTTLNALLSAEYNAIKAYTAGAGIIQGAAASDPFQQSVIRLNTAVALARLGECGVARDELKQVQLPDRPGVGSGTVQYLLGVCAEELGNRAEAEAAFRAAAATESLLTEDGPAVKELAEARLAQLAKPSGQ